MELSPEYIKILKDRNEADVWDYASALLQVQDAIFRLEMDESDPDALRVLAARALEVGRELQTVLKVLGESIEDE